jgi:hypothetical protein
VRISGRALVLAIGVFASRALDSTIRVIVIGQGSMLGRAIGLVSALGALLAVPSATAAEEPFYEVAWSPADASTALTLEDPDGFWRHVPAIAWGPSEYTTTFRAVWNEAGIFVRFEAKTTRPWSTLTARDAPIWEEDAVEVYFDPDRSGHNYAQVDFSPANVVSDVLISTPWPAMQSDPRWDLKGVDSRAGIRREAGKVVGWTVVALLPWEGFRSLPSVRTVTLPPRPGDRWRFNVFRIERPHGPSDPSRETVLAPWSHSQEPSFHVPQAFRDLVFGHTRRPTPVPAASR